MRRKAGCAGSKDVVPKGCQRQFYLRRARRSSLAGLLRLYSKEVVMSTKSVLAVALAKDVLRRLRYLNVTKGDYLLLVDGLN